jgi:uncharacterized protein (TIGR02145 family)
LFVILLFLFQITFVFSQERKIEKKVYSFYKLGKIDEALEGLEVLRNKYNDKSFYYYWHGLINYDKLSDLKKNKNEKINEKLAVSYIDSIIYHFNRSIHLLSEKDFDLDTSSLLIFYPKIEVDNIFLESKRDKRMKLAVNQIQKKINYAVDLKYNLFLNELINEYKTGKNGIEAFIKSVKSRVKDIASENQLYGEVSRINYLELSKIRNRNVLDSLKEDLDDKRWINYLKSFNEEEYFSIFPEIETLINDYYYNLSKKNIINDFNLTSINDKIIHLSSEINQLTISPTNHFNNLYGYSGFSKDFISYRMQINDMLMSFLHKQKLYLEMKMNSRKLLEFDIDQDINYLVLHRKDCDSFLINYKIFNLEADYLNIVRRFNGINHYVSTLNKKSDFYFNNLFQILEEESFNGVSKYSTDWQNVDNDSISLSIGKGKYNLKNKTDKKIKILETRNFNLTQGYELTEYLYSVTVNFVNYDDDKVFDLFFGTKDFLKYFSFGISANGYFHLSKFERGKLTEFKPVTDFKAVNSTGLNELTIKKINGKILFLINFIKIFEVEEVNWFFESHGFILNGKQNLDIERLSLGYSQQAKTPISGYGSNIYDVEGNVYKTIYIGKQQWMAENLRVARYTDGTIIPNIIDFNDWNKNQTIGWSYYKNDESMNHLYGKLYNWRAVSYSHNGNKNLCPVGWHVPNEQEWNVLTDYLVDFTASKLKEVGSSHWLNNNSATNSTFFSALPGGERDSEGFFHDIGYDGNWWSTTLVSSSQARSINIDNYYMAIPDNKQIKCGLSVRCVKD